MSKLKLFYSYINIFLKYFNIAIKRIKNSNQQIFESLLNAKNNLSVNQNDKLYFSFFKYILINIHLSSSQRFQDLFVDWMLQKKNGIFIEFGACDGINISNTYYLEKYMGWSGILLEPAKSWHNNIKINRPNCIIDFRCVSDESGNEVPFYENTDPALSSLNNNFFSNNSYKVKTVSLNDVFFEHEEKLLKKSNEIESIDFISIDTEGTEYQILNKFNFNKYSPKIIIVEHNFDPIKSKLLKELIESNNYVNLFPELSAYDYFFVLKDVLLKKINEE
jgi:FkbM family methyltransferase